MEPTRAELLQEIGAHRMIFVSGLHRSGTTFLASALASHPDVSGLTGTGARKNEGQTLQSVYSADGSKGPGAFGFSEAQHRTETSPEVSEDGAVEVWRAWRPFWDLTKPVVVEKSPPNIVRMRFLSALFPKSCHVVIVRHPIAVTLATRKWRRTTRWSLVHHWVHVHDVMTSDLPHLDAVVVVIRYEDLVSRFDDVWAGLLAGLDLDLAPAPEAPEGGLNERYFERWESRGPAGAVMHRAIAAKFEGAVRRYGYSFAAPYVIGELDSSYPSL